MDIDNRHVGAGVDGRGRLRNLNAVDWSIPLLAFVGFAGGMFVASRVLLWIAALMLALGWIESEETQPRSPMPLLQLVLHSAPWLLALAIGAIYYVHSLSRPALLWLSWVESVSG